MIDKKKDVRYEVVNVMDTLHLFSVRHEERQGPDGNFHCSSCATDFVFYGTERA